MDVQLLKSLSEARGISGQESAVRQVVLNAIDGHGEQIRIDPLGSITAVKPGTGQRRLRVMIAAHMDEIGFMVAGVDGDGLVRFTNVGGVDDRILPGLRVKIGTNGISGVVVWTPIHLNRDQAVVKMSSLRIDIGASSKDDANGKVKLGDMIVFDTRFAELGDQMVRGKAFDDRAGCSLLIDVLRGGPYPVDVLAAFTVQEEIGLRGAQVAAQFFQPDVAFVLEGTTANDIPNPLREVDDQSALNPTCHVLGGPVISIMDRSLIVDPRMFNFLKATATKHEIPYQLKTQLGGGTDGGSIHTANSGVMTGVISLPCRYIHSPAALLHRADYDHALRLIQAVLQDIDDAVVRR
ncbi:MAG: M42 family metallopeptidase [Anaerolineae bacterium]|nr:M42 family metallopeptidase [Anaerolineae bacterium]